MDDLSHTDAGTPPRVTIVTVTMNNAYGLAQTIESVSQQRYENLQYVVVDGGSVDGSLELAQSKKSEIDKWISEPDCGIYHAMNKALILADGEWLIFLNAGDIFAFPDALSRAISCVDNSVDVVYSDWIYRESGKQIKASFERMIVRHQSVMYRKELHRLFGTYVVGPRVTISDFIFFLSLSNRNWAYCSQPISICEQTGISANPAHFYQRMATEFIFGRRTRLEIAAILVIHPIYRWFKKYILFRH